RSISGWRIAAGLKSPAIAAPRKPWSGYGSCGDACLPASSSTGWTPMRGDKAFFDTNLIVSAFAKDDARAEVAEALLAAGSVISVQVLNEFVAVAARKLGMGWDEVLAALDAILVLCPSP